MPGQSAKRIFIIGGTGFLGYRVIQALLDQGADLTVLVRPDGDEKLGPLGEKVRRVQGDVWNAASLRGRSRGHQVIVHLVGSVKPDPSRGLTFRHLNFISARNVTQMAVGDAVPHLVLLSASTAPIGVSAEYIESKRDAEIYLQKSGLAWTVVRAPALYAPGARRNPFYLALSILGYLPLIGLPFQPYAPMSVNTAAYGIASLALSANPTENRLIKPNRLHKIGRALEKRVEREVRESRRETPQPISDDDDDIDEPPFGWQP